MTGRIRWEPNGYGGSVGHVGTMDKWLFQIWHPHPPGWQMESTLPGRFRKHFRSDDLDECKAEAERWLEEFVSSLGAVFPDPVPEPIEETGFAAWSLDRLLGQRKHLDSLLLVSAGQDDPHRAELREEHAAVCTELRRRMTCPACLAGAHEECEDPCKCPCEPANEVSTR